MIKDIMDIIRQKYQQKWMYDKNKIEIARYYDDILCWCCFLIVFV